MDGRPNRRNEAVFSNLSSVVWTRGLSTKGGMFLAWDMALYLLSVRINLPVFHHQCPALFGCVIY